MGERARIQLSPIQIVAGALATMSAAVAASFMGVYGTIIGAAVMSVITTVGSTLYEHSMHRSKAKLRDAREGHLTKVPTGVATRMRKGVGVGVASVRASTRGRLRALARPGWWKPVGAVSLLVFAVAMGAITVMEDVAGKPTYDIVRAGSVDGGSSGTTFRHILGGGSGASDPDGPEQDGAGQEGGPWLPPDRETGPGVRDSVPEEPDVAPSPDASVEDKATSGNAPREGEPWAPAQPPAESSPVPEDRSTPEPQPEPEEQESPVERLPLDGESAPPKPGPTE